MVQIRRAQSCRENEETFILQSEWSINNKQLVVRRGQYPKTVGLVTQSWTQNVASHGDVHDEES